jgi:hypothetical protein
MNSEHELELRRVRRVTAAARKLLVEAVREGRAALESEWLTQETPVELIDAVESALESIDAAIRLLESGGPAESRSAPKAHRGPTRQQGQFLAFIREFMARNQHGVAPSHAAFQRFFNLTAPSVNSMLIRLEQRGFIRRIPRKARAIELTIDPDWIPPLERPFKF